ncbi:MAG: hypothetical protein HY059_14320 [Proteobacteria bacterium]|nr:hypothetical protein [Pseudomonadota bacterium]
MSEEPVQGQRIAAPRPTWRLIPLLVLRVGVPLLAALVLIDLAVFAILHGLFGACYGAFAWVGAC